MGRYGYEEAVRRLQRDTRHFAKRQMTWFRSDPKVQWFALDKDETPENIADRILVHLEESGLLSSSRIH